MGWFIVPKLGEKMVWGMYDLPSRKLDVSYEMAVTGPASVHGLDGVSITAKVIQPQPAISENDPMSDAVGASTGGQEEWWFIAQEKDGYIRKHPELLCQREHSFSVCRCYGFALFSCYPDFKTIDPFSFHYPPHKS